MSKGSEAAMCACACLCGAEMESTGKARWSFGMVTFSMLRDIQRICSVLSSYFACSESHGQWLWCLLTPTHRTRRQGSCLNMQGYSFHHTPAHTEPWSGHFLSAPAGWQDSAHLENKENNLLLHFPHRLPREEPSPWLPGGRDLAFLSILIACCSFPHLFSNLIWNFSFYFPFPFQHSLSNY